MYLNTGSHVAATCAGRSETDNGLVCVWTFLRSAYSSSFHLMIGISSNETDMNGLVCVRTFLRSVYSSSFHLMMPFDDPAPRACLLRLLLLFREYYCHHHHHFFKRCFFTTQHPASVYWIACCRQREGIWRRVLCERERADRTCADRPSVTCRSSTNTSPPRLTTSGTLCMMCHFLFSFFSTSPFTAYI
jgi:hypothetical protein